MQTVISKYVNKLVKVRLLDNALFLGTLISIDGEFNLILQQAIIQRGDSRKLIKLAFVRGEQVQYVIFSSETGVKLPERPAQTAVEPPQKMIPGLNNLKFYAAK